MKYVQGQKQLFQNTPLLKRIRKLIFHLVGWVKTGFFTFYACLTLEKYPEPIYFYMKSKAKQNNPT